MKLKIIDMYLFFNFLWVNIFEKFRNFFPKEFLFLELDLEFLSTKPHWVSSSCAHNILTINLYPQYLFNIRQNNMKK